MNPRDATRGSVEVEDELVSVVASGYARPGALFRRHVAAAAAGGEDPLPRVDLAVVEGKGLFQLEGTVRRLPGTGGHDLTTTAHAAQGVAKKPRSLRPSQEEALRPEDGVSYQGGLNVHVRSLTVARDN